MSQDERTVVRRGDKPRGGKNRHTPRPNASRIDQALFQAKNSGKLVMLCLAVESPYTGDDCTVTGYVEQVDTYDVSLKLTSGHERVVWFKKSAIVTTEVLR